MNSTINGYTWKQKIIIISITKINSTKCCATLARTQIQLWQTPPCADTLYATESCESCMWWNTRSPETLKTLKKVSPSLSLMSKQNVRLAECIMMVCNGTRWHSIVPIPSTLQLTVSLYGFYTGNFEPPKQPLKNANFETKSGRCDARRYLSDSAGLGRSAYFLATYIHNFHHLYKNRQWVDKN